MELLDKTVVLLVGFLLTSVAGGFVGYFFKTRSWASQVRQDLYRARYDEGTLFLNDLSTCIGERYFLMQRFLWALEKGDGKVLSGVEEEYFPVITKWNSGYWRIRNKLRLLVNQEAVDAFLDYADDNRADKPKSLHYHFVTAHKALASAKESQEMLPAAQKTMQLLNWHCSDFLETTTEFLRRAAALELLLTPEKPKLSAEQAHSADAQKERTADA